MDRIPVFYVDEINADSDSLAVLGTQPGTFGPQLHPVFSPSAAKPKLVLDAWRNAGLPLDIRPVVAARVEDICAVHDAVFVREILACTAANGFDNYRADVARSLPYTSGAMLCAGDHALRHGIACAPVSGFHHAGYATARGFCTFNGLMIAAWHLVAKRHVARVLILDLDMHRGEGTDDIITRLELGDRIENVTFGRWYHEPHQADEYLAHVAREAKRFGDFGLILYQAGADVHVDDPLGGVLTAEGISLRDQIVFQAAQRSGVPLAWNLAGGYQDPVSKVVLLHVNTMRECVQAYLTIHATSTQGGPSP